MNKPIEKQPFQPTNTRGKPRPKGGVIEFVKTVLVAMIIVVLVRTFAFEPFNIPSGSMIPSLLVGDYLFVSKFSYGYSRYSLPWGIKLWSGRILGSTPKRGDVVVFKWPADNRTDYIKRLIGLPGDTVELRNGRLWINGAIVERVGVNNGESEMIDEYSTKLVHRYIEKLPSSEKGVKATVDYQIQQYSDFEPNENFPVQCGAGALRCQIKVPEGHYFMMGDNRDNSADSRISIAAGGVGLVPAENLVGKAQFLFISLDNASQWEIWKLPYATRWERVFSWIK